MAGSGIFSSFHLKCGSGSATLQRFTPERYRDQQRRAFCRLEFRQPVLRFIFRLSARSAAALLSRCLWPKHHPGSATTNLRDWSRPGTAWLFVQQSPCSSTKQSSKTPGWLRSLPCGSNHGNLHEVRKKFGVASITALRPGSRACCQPCQPMAHYDSPALAWDDSNMGEYLCCLAGWGRSVDQSVHGSCPMFRQPNINKVAMAALQLLNFGSGIAFRFRLWGPFQIQPLFQDPYFPFVLRYASGIQSLISIFDFLQPFPRTVFCFWYIFNVQKTNNFFACSFSVWVVIYSRLKVFEFSFAG